MSDERNGKRAHIDDARECLNSSRALLDARLSDGAANRLFFAAFYAMRAVLSGCVGLPVLKVKTHRGLEYLFQMHVIKQDLIDRKFTKTIAQLSQVRRTADFDPMAVPLERVEQAFGDVVAFVDACGLLIRARGAGQLMVREVTS